MYLSLAENLGRTGWGIAQNKYKKNVTPYLTLASLGTKSAQNTIDIIPILLKIIEFPWNLLSSSSSSSLSIESQKPSHISKSTYSSSLIDCAGQIARSAILRANFSLLPGEQILKFQLWPCAPPYYIWRPFVVSWSSTNAVLVSWTMK